MKTKANTRVDAFKPAPSSVAPEGPVSDGGGTGGGTEHRGTNVLMSFVSQN